MHLSTTPPSYPGSSFPLTSGRKRTTLELSDLKSENSGLPVELRMPKPEINMANIGEFGDLSPESDGKGQGVNFALLIIGRNYVTLDEKQMEILRIVIVERKRRRVASRFRQVVSSLVK